VSSRLPRQGTQSFSVIEYLVASGEALPLRDIAYGMGWTRAKATQALNHVSLRYGHLIERRVKGGDWKSSSMAAQLIAPSEAMVLRAASSNRLVEGHHQNTNRKSKGRVLTLGTYAGRVVEVRRKYGHGESGFGVYVDGVYQSDWWPCLESVQRWAVRRARENWE